MRHMDVVRLQKVFLLTMYLTESIRANLTCYHCFTKWEYDDCVLKPNQSNTKVCNEKEPYCMVLRNETFGKFTFLRRDCASSCRPICGIWGEDVDWESCYSCCTTDLCNTDNGGAFATMTMNGYIFVLVVTISWINTSSCM